MDDATLALSQPSEDTITCGSLFQSTHGRPGARSSVLGRESVAGRFSAIEFGGLTVDAEPGLRIRVYAGFLWVPQPEYLCSVYVGAGEQIVVRTSGAFTVLASQGAEMELHWPMRDRRPYALI